MAVSLRHVAEWAGVSMRTVSNVASGFAMVAPETRAPGPGRDRRAGLPAERGRAAACAAAAPGRSAWPSRRSPRRTSASCACWPEDGRGRGWTLLGPADRRRGGAGTRDDGGRSGQVRGRPGLSPWAVARELAGGRTPHRWCCSGSGRRRPARPRRGRQRHGGPRRDPAPDRPRPHPHRRDRPTAAPGERHRRAAGRGLPAGAGRGRDAADPRAGDRGPAAAPRGRRGRDARLLDAGPARSTRSSASATSSPSARCGPALARRCGFPTMSRSSVRRHRGRPIRAPSLTTVTPDKAEIAREALDCLAGPDRGARMPGPGPGGGARPCRPGEYDDRRRCGCGTRSTDSGQPPDIGVIGVTHRSRPSYPMSEAAPGRAPPEAAASGNPDSLVA